MDCLLFVINIRFHKKQQQHQKGVLIHVEYVGSGHTVLSKRVQTWEELHKDMFEIDPNYTLYLGTKVITQLPKTTQTLTLVKFSMKSYLHEKRVRMGQYRLLPETIEPRVLEKEYSFNMYFKTKTIKAWMRMNRLVSNHQIDSILITIGSNTIYNIPDLSYFEHKSHKYYYVYDFPVGLIFGPTLANQCVVDLFFDSSPRFPIRATLYGEKLEYNPHINQHFVIPQYNMLGGLRIPIKGFYSKDPHEYMMIDSKHKKLTKFDNYYSLDGFDHENLNTSKAIPMSSIMSFEFKNQNITTNAVFFGFNILQVNSVIANFVYI